MIKKKFILNHNENTHLTVYIPDHSFREDKYPMVIVVPGGSYLHCSKREGEPVAMHFLRHNMNVAVLEYSHGSSNPNGTYLDAQKELAMSVKLIRQNAEQWHVDTNKIVICGFSAGGHICTYYSNTFQNNPVGTVDELKVNAVILGYPVTSTCVSLETSRRLVQSEPANEKEAYFKDYLLSINRAMFNKEVPDEAEHAASVADQYINELTPPTFIWTTFADGLVPPSQSIDYAVKLHNHHIPCALHVFQSGDHGLSLADETVCRNDEEKNEEVAQWADLAVQWLKQVL